MTAVFSIIMVIILLVIVAIPIIIGGIIYKDAKVYDLNPWLWALVAVLVPNFLGIVIYLIIRNNKAQPVFCSACGAKAGADYNICPNCRSTFEKTCVFCKHALPSAAGYCPYCGETAAETGNTPTAEKKVIKTHLGKSLAILLVAFFAMIILLVVIATPIYSTEKSFFSSNVSLMDVETNWKDQIKSSFGYKQGTENKKIAMKPGDYLDCSFDIKKGYVIMDVTSEEGTELFHKRIENCSESFKISPDSSIAQKVLIQLTFKKASGSYQIDKKPEAE